MTDYTYSRVAALNFNTTPPTVGKSATGSVYAIGDTTFTTPLNVTFVVGGSTSTTISSDANGFFPDFTVANRTSVVFKQNASSFTGVLTTTDPVPGPQGDPGNDGAEGPQGPRGDLASWQASTFYPLNQVISNPTGDLVKVTTAHTSGVSYDASKFTYANANAANLTGTMPDGVLPARLAEASLNATFVGAAAGTPWVKVPAASVTSDTILGLAFKRKKVKREQYTLRVPLASLSLESSPFIANSNTLTAITYASPATPIAYANKKLTVGNNVNGTQADTAWQAFSFEPFATVDLTVDTITASTYGRVSINAASSTSPTTGKRIIVTYRQETKQISAECLIDGAAQATLSPISVSTLIDGTGQFTLRAQYQGRSVAIWAITAAETRYIGRLSTLSLGDLRTKSLFAGWTVGLEARGHTDFQAVVSKFEQYVSGSGHADPRIVSYEDGTPIQEGNKFTVLMTTRGVDIPDAYQGVFSLNPTTGEMTMTGAILCDRNDGILHNDNAGHLFFDRRTGKWNYLTVDHSDWTVDGSITRVNYVAETTIDPRQGFNVLKVSAVTLPSTTNLWEDMYPIWDAGANKWVATASKDASISVRLEASALLGPWTEVASGGTSETGNQIVAIGSGRVIVAGTGSTGYTARNYDTLASLGALNIDTTMGGTRIWPAIFPMAVPGGTKWFMLSFDRSSPAGSYSYGAWGLYEAR